MVNLLSISSYLPEKKINNSEITQFHPNVISKIQAKTGIMSRHKIDAAQKCSDIAINAALACMGKISFPPDKVDALIFASSTPDRIIPATATRIAHSIGAKNAFAFDLNSVCTSGLFAMEIARSLIASNSASNVLVVAADVYSKILNPKDFSTFPYFGDGASALLLSNEEGIAELYSSVLHSDGAGFETITIKAGGSEESASTPILPNDVYFSMKGREVYDFAVAKAPECILEALEKSGLRVQDISQFVLHQANINILNAIAEKLGADTSLFFSNLQKYGNTAGASVLIALSEYLQQRIPSDRYIVLSAFGGGLSWGATVIKTK